MDAPNYDSILQSATQQAQAQGAPVISGLQNQQSGLKDQYQSLIGQLNGQEQQAIGQTNTQTSRDFGARGIPLSSGLFNQTLGERTQPITTDYTNRITSANADQTNSLNQLATQIAQAQSGVTDQARSLAQQQYGNAQNAYQSQLDEAYRQSQAATQAQQFAQQLASQNAATKAASAPPQVNYAQPAPTQQPGQVSQQLNSAVLGALKGANGKGPADNYVDANEANLAFQQLQRNGYSADQAKQVVLQVMQQNGLQKYGGW